MMGVSCSFSESGQDHPLRIYDSELPSLDEITKKVTEGEQPVEWGVEQFKQGRLAVVRQYAPEWLDEYK